LRLATCKWASHLHSAPTSNRSNEQRNRSDHKGPAGHTVSAGPESGTNTPRFRSFALAKTAANEISQTLKAAQALVSHIQKEQKRLRTASQKKDLLSTGDSEDEAQEKVPIWLVLGTKKFIQDKKRLKPSKIALPHPFGSSDARVCLITANPQRAYKNLMADPTFPTSVSSRISRVIEITVRLYTTYLSSGVISILTISVAETESQVQELRIPTTTLR
jgi:hypothetical protein